MYAFIFQTESMLKIAEDLGGPYVWGQYDLLVLPPSFPYGGMENPCLTFVTPTLLVRDISSFEISNVNLDEGLGHCSVNKGLAVQFRGL